MPEDQPTFALPGSKAELEEGDLFTPRFNDDGLIPAIVTDVATGEILMFAFMNAEALLLTIQTREGHFFSRSRGKLWRKGEDSGNVLEVASLRTDCDQDVLWLSVRIRGHGSACHTGRKTCFYRELEWDGSNSRGFSLKEVVRDKAFSPSEVYGQKSE